MAAGDPIKVNLDSAIFTLTAETGVIIQSSDRSVDARRKDVFNAAVGYVTGYVFYDFVATQDVNAIVNGTDGLTVAAPGVALALANDLGIGAAKNGVASGTIYTTGVRISHQGEDLRMISCNTLQRHGITV